MKKICIIGASELQLPLILKAKEMGYETHVFAWEDGAVGKDNADFFYPISITEKEEILSVCEKIKIDAVASISSDLAVLTVNYISRKLGFRANSEYTDIVSTNKLRMRKVFEEKGIPSPLYSDEVNLNKLLEEGFDFPIMVKATDRSGSRGITKVISAEDFDEAIKDAMEVSFAKEIIVEEYIDGDEYSCESISFDGEHSILAFTKKNTTGAPHFIETRHNQPSGLSDDQIIEAEKLVVKALTALDIKYGASHTEFKITTDGKIKFIEVGSRMGGDCIGSHLVPLSTGYDYLKMVIDVASGKRPDLKIKDHYSAAFVQYIYNVPTILGYKNFEENVDSAIQYSHISDDTFSRVVTDSSSRYGLYVVAEGPKILIEEKLYEEN